MKITQTVNQNQTSSSGGGDQLTTIKFLEEDQIHSLLSVITSARDRAIFSLAYYHGLRASEVGLLRERDYDPETPQMYIRRVKNGRSRWQILTDNERSAINQWYKLRGRQGDDTPFFVSRRGTAIARRTLDYLMKLYGKRAGIPIDKQHFHVLRHSCATHMVRADIEIIKIRDWLGHKDIENTLIYATVSDSAMQDTGGAWSDFTKGKGKDKDRNSKVGRKVLVDDSNVVKGIVWGKDKYRKVRK